MSDENWFALHDNEQTGPHTFETLLQMIREQSLGREDLVWLAGTPGWVPANQVPALCAAAGWGELQTPSLPVAPRASFEEQVRPQIDGLRQRVGELDKTQGALEALPHLRWLRRLLDGLGRQVTRHQLDLADRQMKRIGSLAYMLAALLYGVFFAVMSLRADSIQQFLASLLIVIPGASLCHFIAVHCIEASEETLESTPTQLSSKTLGLSLGLLLGAAGLLLLFAAGHDLFKKIHVVESIMLLPLAIGLLYMAAACFNLDSLKIDIVPRSDGAREAIGISMLMAKLLLRAAPVAFGLASLLAVGSAVFFCHQWVTGEMLELRFIQAVAIAPRVLLLGLLPMGLYLLAVFWILWTDSFRAWLDTSEAIRGLAKGLER